MTTEHARQSRISPAAGRARHGALIANLEATSFLVLLACMILKYAGPKIGGPVLVMGWIHGILFLAFLWVIVRARLTLGWTKRRTWLAAGSSVIPFAPYPSRTASRQIQTRTERPSSPSTAFRRLNAASLTHSLVCLSVLAGVAPFSTTLERFRS